MERSDMLDKVCKYIKINIILIVMICALSACTQDARVEGVFGWARTDDRGIEEPEKSLLSIEEYRLGSESVYFFDFETIWWMYEITGGGLGKDEFIVALYENNATPQPVEVELRTISVFRDGGKKILRDSFDPLPQGRYLLRIAFQSIIIDEAEFTVVPPGGPPAIIDDEIEEEPADPIRSYSRL
jgi:hypothetical protein